MPSKLRNGTEAKSLYAESSMLPNIFERIAKTETGVLALIELRKKAADSSYQISADSKEALAHLLFIEDGEFSKYFGNKHEGVDPSENIVLSALTITDGVLSIRDPRANPPKGLLRWEGISGLDAAGLGWCDIQVATTSLQTLGDIDEDAVVSLSSSVSRLALAGSAESKEPPIR